MKKILNKLVNFIDKHFFDKKKITKSEVWITNFTIGDIVYITNLRGIDGVIHNEKPFIVMGFLNGFYIESIEHKDYKNQPYKLYDLYNLKNNIKTESEYKLYLREKNLKLLGIK